MDKFVGRSVRITSCWNQVKGYENYVNITPDSIHAVITPELPKFNSDTLIWVKGVSTPVMLLKWEFKYVSRRTKF